MLGAQWVVRQEASAPEQDLVLLEVACTLMVDLAVARASVHEVLRLVQFFLEGELGGFVRGCPGQ